MKIHGQELWADVAVEGPVLDDAPAILAALHAGAAAISSTVLSEHHQRFEPEGVTAVVVIGESHLLASTYAELGIVAVNIQTCSAAMDLVAGLEAIAASLGASEVRSMVVMRRLDTPMRVVFQGERIGLRDGRLELEAGVDQGFSASAAIR